MPDPAQPPPGLAAPDRISRICLVLKRFGLRIALILSWTTLNALLGSSGWGTLFVMMWGAAVVCAILAIVLKEPFIAPYFTHYDEAAWFLLIALAAKQILLTVAA
ncbi:hypothetical protein OPKNFCMD_6378 [Methylobacterium crusticola]|uniref:Uncharacterized protein n=1 Tax=Methylobacterium crusticola TaxID=1697972 RepID=A0ABQ4R9Z7_9HYPH|nr:hypothetical protein [Methylobacterium crusticola]GJD53601.1 hypothetical protein OPKNFCMD_6378 [Methylobacterium crusticola]